MKLKTFILAVIASVFCSCGEPGPAAGEEPKGKVILDVDRIELSHEAQTSVISVDADCDWGVFSQDSWIKVSPTGGVKGLSEVKVTVEENKSGEPRESVLLFRYGSSRIEVPVVQDFPVLEMEVPEGYRLVWREEFDAEGESLPDTESWWFETGDSGWGNNELQDYVAGGEYKGEKLAKVKDGKLTITARKIDGKVRSVRMNTIQSWTYGYFEARLKLPKGKGTWPAFWMMPKNFTAWPKDGEIDIMEHVGYHENYVSSSIHCTAYVHSNGTQKTKERLLKGATDEFHVYALEWTPEYIRSYVDGEQLFYYNPEDYPKGRNADTWPFNDPFYLKLNLAWGGNWGGAMGIDESCLPAVYEIDYVRVFQKKQ